MRLALGVLAATVIGLGIAACGSAGSHDSSRAGADRGGAVTGPLATANSTIAHVVDGEHYSDDPGDDDPVLEYGRAAGAADHRALIALVERYYAAAEAGDGAATCPLVISSLARSVPEDYGRPPGPPYARGTTCATVSSKLLAHAHAQLTDVSEILGVRVNGRIAVVLLGSHAVATDYVSALREAPGWRLAVLVNGHFP